MFSCCEGGANEIEAINKLENKEYSEYLKNYLTIKTKNPTKVYTQNFDLKPYKFDEELGIIEKEDFPKFKNPEKQKILESFYKNLVNINNYYPVNKFPIYDFGSYIYQGNIENGKKSSYGRIYFKETELYYEGEWFDGYYNGQGLKINADDSYEFGNFENGFLKGNNILISKSSGYLYTGDVVDGKETGSAFIKYSKTDLYKGEVKDGLKSGYGTFKTLNKTLKGTFKKDELNGKDGEIIYYDDENKFSKKFTGTFRQGELNGLGTIQFNNNSVFKGSFKNGLKEGNGQLITNDGRIYTGFWENGTLNGDGYFTKNGLTIEVKYEDGKIVS